MSDMYYTRDELVDIGFEIVGRNNKISRLAKFYASKGSVLGSNTRIDDFCLFKNLIRNWSIFFALFVSFFFKIIYLF